ncbi:hypothetical protein AAY473_025417 [Plecturocebus cupreus]
MGQQVLTATHVAQYGFLTTYIKVTPQTPYSGSHGSRGCHTCSDSPGTIYVLIPISYASVGLTLSQDTEHLSRSSVDITVKGLAELGPEPTVWKAKFRCRLENRGADPTSQEKTRMSREEDGAAQTGSEMRKPVLRDRVMGDVTQTYGDAESVGTTAAAPAAASRIILSTDKATVKPALPAKYSVIYDVCLYTPAQSPRVPAAWAPRVAQHTENLSSHAQHLLKASAQEEFETSLVNKGNPVSTENTPVSQACWCTPVVSAIREAET